MTIRPVKPALPAVDFFRYASFLGDLASNQRDLKNDIRREALEVTRLRCKNKVRGGFLVVELSKPYTALLTFDLKEYSEH